MDTSMKSKTLNNNGTTVKSGKDDSKIKKYKKEIIWRNVIFLLYIHLSSLYAAYLGLFASKWQTPPFGKFL